MPVVYFSRHNWRAFYQSARYTQTHLSKNYESEFPKYFVTNPCYSDSVELMETIEASFDHLIRENLMGEARKDALKLDFNRRLKLEFHGTKVTSDAGLLAY